MKKCIFTILFLLSLIQIQAGDGFQNIYIVGGYNNTMVTNDQGRGSSINSAHGGVLIEWYWVDNFYLQTGAFFMPKGYESYLKLDRVNMPYKINAYYLEVPLLAVYKFPVHKNISLFVDAGFYYSIGLFGKMKLDNYGTWKSSYDIFGRNKNKDVEQWESYDIGWQVGGGIELFDKFRIRANYEQGFISLLKFNNHLNRFNTFFGVSLGYCFLSR